MELDPDFLGAVELEETGRLIPFIRHFSIGGVVTYKDIIFDGKIHKLLVKVPARDCRCRVVRIVHEHYPGFLCNILRNRAEIGEKSVLLEKRDSMRNPARETYRCRINGIFRVRIETYIPGVEEGMGSVCYPLLGADEGHVLGFGVELHTEPLHIPVGDCRPE